MASDIPTSLYNAQFMDHVTHPDYKYELEDATHTHAGVNPTCGDALSFSVRLASNGTIDEAAFTGTGCAISQASADMMADVIIGKTPQDAIRLARVFTAMVRGEINDESLLEELGEAAMLHDIAHMPARVKCAELAWRTLEEMLDGKSESTTTTEGEGA